jgi:hypothetical protein
LIERLHISLRWSMGRSLGQRSKLASSYVAALVLDKWVDAANLPIIMSDVGERTVMRAFPIAE